MTFQMKLIGSKEAQHMMDRLPDAAFRRVMRPSLSAAIRPVTEAGKREAPKKTRSLSKSIGVKNVTYKKSKTVVSVVGPRRGQQYVYIQKGKSGRKHAPANYGHLVHDGTKAHFLKRTDTGKRERYVVRPKKKKAYARTRKIYKYHGKRHPGAAANPFLRRAWKLSENRSMSILRSEVGKRIPIEARKLAGKKR